MFNNFIRILCVIIVFGLMTACGGGGGGGNSASVPTTSLEPISTQSPQIGALIRQSANTSWWIIVGRVPAQGITLTDYGQTYTLNRGAVRTVSVAAPALPRLNRISISFTREASGFPNFNTDSIFEQAITSQTIVSRGSSGPFGESTSITMTLRDGDGEVLFETREDITLVAQLCPIPWLVAAINDYFVGNSCPSSSALSHSPDMRRVVYAAMSDGFNRGFAFGESGFAFSGRYDNNDRAAGFTYDMGSYALRTDYIRLPSKQDNAVWLDTYRFGILRPINDEAEFFAGVDSYRNAIFAIDTSGDIAHRFGAAVGDGYAVKYELRLNL